MAMRTNSLAFGLTQAAAILNTELRRVLKSGKYPDEILAGINVTRAKITDTGGYIDIEFHAPMSRAFEEGSGEHGPEGESYEIRPKNAEALAFEWDKMPRGPGPKFIGAVGEGSDPLLMFRYVDHPGIEPRPYIKPSIEKKRKEMKKAIGQEFKAIIRDGRSKVTEI